MKKNKFKRLLSMTLSVCLSLAVLPATALAAGEMDGKTVIVYSANIRGNIDVLPQISTLKSTYEQQGADVILADTGNYLQGTVYSAYDSGKTVIDLMDKVGYDVVAIGSREFDFGTGKVGVEQHEVYYADDTLGKLLDAASFSAVSANILLADENINAFTPSVTITTEAGQTIGFFGLTDPDTVNQVLESNLEGLSFQDGAETAAKQALELAECSFIIGLSNIGTLTATDGITIIDIGAEAGFAVGTLIIDNLTGEIEQTAINLDTINRDTATEAVVNAAKATVDAEYPPSAIVKAEVTLEGSMTASRSGETNTGNLWTDALRWFAVEGGIANYYDEDEINNGNDGVQVEADNIVAIWNGGNLRDYLNSGDVTLKDIKRVLPYPNRVAVVYLTGAQLLELLESATQGLPYSAETSAACAAFPQVAGINYTVSTNVPYSAGEAYGNNWFKATSIQRVKINNINGKAFDAAAIYAVITSNAIANGMDSNYICLEKDPDLSTITTAAVVDVVWMYITQKLNGTIGSQYAATQGRITIDSTIAPTAEMTRAMLAAALYNLAGAPADGIPSPSFDDVPTGSPYASAIAWAAANGITLGTSQTKFSPNDSVTRQQLAVFIYRYFGEPAVSDVQPPSDAGDIAAWAEDAVLYCMQNNILSASETGFNPNATVTHSEGEAIITRLQ